MFGNHKFVMIVFLVSFYISRIFNTEMEKQNFNIIRKPFYFLRHGETDLNKQHKHQGTLDIEGTELNEVGIHQAKQAQLILDRHEIRSVYSSPLKRTQQTSKIIAENRNCSIYFVDDLKDRYKGKAEGQPYKNFPLRHTYFPLNDQEPFGAESSRKFFNRVINSLNQILETSDFNLIVAHTPVLTCICYHLGLEMTDQMKNNCQPILFKPLDDGWEVILLS